MFASRYVRCCYFFYFLFFFSFFFPTPFSNHYTARTSAHLKIQRVMIRKLVSPTKSEHLLDRNKIQTIKETVYGPMSPMWWRIRPRMDVHSVTDLTSGYDCSGRCWYKGALKFMKIKNGQKRFPYFHECWIQLWASNFLDPVLRTPSNHNGYDSTSMWVSIATTRVLRGVWVSPT